MGYLLSQGDSLMGTLLQAAHEEPIPAARRVASVPRDLDTICLKCLEKDPAKRYATAGELADDLERFLNHEAIQARPLSRWGTPASGGPAVARPGRRHWQGSSHWRSPGRAWACGWPGSGRRPSPQVGRERPRSGPARRSVLVGRGGRSGSVGPGEQIGYDAPADLRQRLDQARRDVDLAERLDAIRLKKATAVEGWHDVAAERRSSHARAYA